jgi:copper chaperone CopZ
MLPGTPRTFVGSTTFTVPGLTAGVGERAVVEHISAVPGVESVTVEVASGVVAVRAAVPVDRADIAAAITEAGFALVP